MAEAKMRSRENAVAREALERNGLVIVAAIVEEARAITNRLAPEHLTVDAASDLDWVTNAGSVFVGRWSAQPMGDYISGPNHTLPTGGMARVRGGLSVNDFVKLITVQEYTRAGLRALGPQAALLAEAEGLVGHAEAIRARLAQQQAQRQGGPVAEAVITLHPAPRARVQAMKEYHPPLGQPRCAAPGLQREHAGLLAEGARGAGAASPPARSRAIPSASRWRRSWPRISACAPEQVALTNGVDEAIHVLFETFLEAGDELLLPVPTYTMYEVYASATDARVVTVQAADDLQFPFERLLAAITPRTKMIAIANPNSPSGSVATREQLAGIGAARAAGGAAGG